MDKIYKKDKHSADNFDEFLEIEYQEFVEKYGITDMSKLTPEEFVRLNEEIYAINEESEIKLIYRKEVPY